MLGSTSPNKTVITPTTTSTSTSVKARGLALERGIEKPVQCANDDRAIQHGPRNHEKSAQNAGWWSRAKRSVRSDREDYNFTGQARLRL